MRLAYLLMFKSKDELAAGIEESGQEPLELLMESFSETKEWAEQAISLLRTAEARIICATAALAKHDEGDDPRPYWERGA